MTETVPLKYCAGCERNLPRAMFMDSKESPDGKVSDCNYCLQKRYAHMSHTKVKK